MIESVKKSFEDRMLAVYETDISIDTNIAQYGKASYEAGGVAMYSIFKPVVEWIDVNEALPKIWETVLCKHNDYIEYSLSFIDGSGQWIHDIDKAVFRKAPTHWKKINL